MLLGLGGVGSLESRIGPLGRTRDRPRLVWQRQNGEGVDGKSVIGL